MRGSSSEAPNRLQLLHKCLAGDPKPAADAQGCPSPSAPCAEDKRPRGEKKHQPKVTPQGPHCQPGPRTHPPVPTGKGCGKDALLQEELTQLLSPKPPRASKYYSVCKNLNYKDAACVFPYGLSASQLVDDQTSQLSHNSGCF